MYSRSHEKQRLLVILNFGGEAQSCEARDAEGGRILLSTYLDRDERLTGERISPRANEGMLTRVEGS